jgi:hypothetical protein
MGEGAAGREAVAQRGEGLSQAPALRRIADLADAALEIAQHLVDPCSRRRSACRARPHPRQRPRGEDDDGSISFQVIGAARLPEQQPRRAAHP